ncbi:MAG TPA: AMP-binding protein, partial [Phenylobacterium sp.]|nr:AMP-binding protein [Phenylobacterium sp.]
MEDLKDRASLDQRLEAAAMVGMTTAVWASVQPDKVAIVDPNGRSKTFAEINAAANKLTRLFRERGLKAGDSLALVCSNRAEFVEVLAATLRAGIRITPVNWHLTPDEIAYIIKDCEAKILVGEQRVHDDQDLRLA